MWFLQCKKLFLILQMCRKFKFGCGCHSGPKTTKYNVGHPPWYNIHTTLPECCLNVGWCRSTLWQCCGNIGVLVEIQHWYNIHTTLPECCLNVGWRRSTLRFWSQYNVGTTFIQCCLDVHTTLLGHLKASTNERCHKVETTLLQRWSLSWVATGRPTLWRWKLFVRQLL